MSTTPLLPPALAAWAHRLLGWATLIPHSLLALLARIGIAATFWRSGQTKIVGWGDAGFWGTLKGMITEPGGWALKDQTWYLFENMYQVPVLPPAWSAVMATVNEHVFPVFILLGLATRLAVLPLLGMTLVIQTFVFPSDYPSHSLWAVAMLYLLARGPGVVSLDRVVGPRLIGSAS